VPRFGHHCFLANTFQIIIYLSSILFFKSEYISPLIHKLLNVAISAGVTAAWFYIHIHEVKFKKQRKVIPETARGGP
jgi:uncharacterized metal-binding protein